MTVLEKIFSAIPGQNSPAELLQTYQHQVINGIKIHVIKLEETIRMDLSLLIQKIDTIDCSRRFSPAIFNLYSKIQSFYEMKNLEGLFHIIQRLRNLDERTIYADELTFSSFLSENWEEFIIPDLKEAIPRDYEDKSLFPLISWKLENFPPTELTTVLEYFQDLDEDLYQEFTTYTSRLKFFASKKLMACTSAKFFGAIYMRPAYSSEDSIVYYLESLVHEVSHLHLYAMMSEDPMILNDPNELFSSPLRPDLRSMYGIFHAAFVLSRIVRILRRYQQHDANVLQLVSQKETYFREACLSISQNAQLTEVGKELFQTFESCAFEN